MKAFAVRSTKRGGFTLIELLAVVVIIGILAGGVFLLMRTSNTKANIAKTTAQVHAIASLLEEYKAIYGEYPVVTTQYTYNDKSIGYAALDYHFIVREGKGVHVSYTASGSAPLSSGMTFKIKDGTSTRTVTPKYTRGVGDEMTFGLCSHFMPRAGTILNKAGNDLKPYYNRQFQEPKSGSPYELEMRGLGTGASNALELTAAKEEADPHLQQIYRSWRRLVKDGFVYATVFVDVNSETMWFTGGAEQDAWGHSMVYKNEGGSGEIVSAGPDGIFGTADDITSGGAGIDEGEED